MGEGVPARIRGNGALDARATRKYDEPMHELRARGMAV